MLIILYINKFINKTIKNYKQPVLIFGANWCPDCRIFSGTINIPKVKSYIDNYFEILYIDRHGFAVLIVVDDSEPETPPLGS